MAIPEYNDDFSAVFVFYYTNVAYNLTPSQSTGEPLKYLLFYSNLSVGVSPY